jgi:YggT family protein
MREIFLELLGALLTLVVWAFLLRFLFQVVRADFRNPISQAIVQLTNWLVLPLRRILPPIGRTDTASLVAVLLVQIAVVAIMATLSVGLIPGPLPLLVYAVFELLDKTLYAFQVAIFVYVLLSWIAPDAFNPGTRLVGSLCEPVIRPFRRALPNLGGLDISPMVALLVLWFVGRVLDSVLKPQLLRLL